MKTIKPKEIKTVYDKTFILTDSCMWEMNKQNKNNNPHAIQVVDVDTGQVRYIKSGSRIRFLGGEITEGHNQAEYNKINTKTT